MHLFTCNCGEAFPVSTAQSGQTVDCPSCEKPQTLPKLGELRQLPIAEDTSPTPTTTNWDAGRGFTFALLFAGLLVFLGTAGWSTYKWRSVEEPLSREEIIEQGKTAIGYRNAPQLLEFWTEFGKPGMGSRKLPAYSRIKIYRDGWKLWAFGAYAGTLLCSAGIIGILRSKPKS